MLKQARFWVFINSAPVRIKLNAGQTLHHSYCVQTDEGYSAEANRWEFDGEMVVNELTQDARDCDGRISHYADLECGAAYLTAGYIDPDYDGIRYPAWEQTSRGQRDYSAEAMNY